MNPIAYRVMSIEDAQTILDEKDAYIEGLKEDDSFKAKLRFRFDYVWGRPIKVGELNGAVDRADLYDRDAYPGAFADAVKRALE